MNEKVSEAIASTIQQALTSYNSMPEITGIKMMPEVILDPFERLKRQNFEQGYTFKTIDDLPLPENFDAAGCINTAIQLQEKNSTTIQNNLSCIKLSPGTLFYSVSGDEVAVDKGKQQNFIELLEIVKQIPVDSLSDDELKVTAKKLLHFYTSNF
jgi:hypothetical protein